jgi:hypothetical protein
MLHCFAGLAEMVTQELLVLFTRTGRQPRAILQATRFIDESNSASHSWVSDASPHSRRNVTRDFTKSVLGKGYSVSSQRFSVTRCSDQAVASSSAGH